MGAVDSEGKAFFCLLLWIELLLELQDAAAKGALERLDRGAVAHACAATGAAKDLDANGCGRFASDGWDGLVTNRATEIARLDGAMTTMAREWRRVRHVKNRASSFSVSVKMASRIIPLATMRPSFGHENGIAPPTLPVWPLTRIRTGGFRGW